MREVGGRTGFATLSLPGRLAQLGERQLDKLEVTGSSPVPPTPAIPDEARPNGRASLSPRDASTGSARRDRADSRWPAAAAPAPHPAGSGRLGTGRRRSSG